MSSPEPQVMPEVGQVLALYEYDQEQVAYVVHVIDVSRSTNYWIGKVLHATKPYRLEVGDCVSFSVTHSTYLRKLLDEQEALMYQLSAAAL